jgi:SEC-C motif-containing protein
MTATMTKDKNFPCPCCSGKPYVKCCEVYHLGNEPKTAEVLMRSRFSAYALNNVDYIIRTTHPRHPSVSQNRDLWKKEILSFCLGTRFEKLEVLDAKELPDRATVIFIAHLKQGDEDVSFTERSFFARVDGKWLYVNGDVYPGVVKDLKV